MIHRRRWLALASAAVTSAALLPCWLSAEEGFEPIFDGKSLDGWEGDRKLWLAENGELVGRSPGIHYNDFLVHRERFSNFVLKLSVRLVNNAGNSGIQFRSERVPNSTEMYGYQADVGPGWWGNLYDESRRRRTLVEFPENEREKTVRKDGWNEYTILAHGKQIRQWLNGTLTVDYTESSELIARDGLIAVQIHSGPALEVRFRDLRIRRM